MNNDAHVIVASPKQNYFTRLQKGFYTLVPDKFSALDTQLFMTNRRLTASSHLFEKCLGPVSISVKMSNVH